MNVLVYSGPGTTAPCVDQCIDTFRSLFTPYYSVTTVSEKVLQEQPWESKTAILIIPGGADLPICRLFKGAINDRIKEFVRKGGKFIGICSGGYYSSGRCEFEVGNPTMEVSGPRDLKFFAGICRGSVVKGFEYGKETGARAVEITTNTKVLSGVAPSLPVYVNGGGVFLDVQKYSNVEVLATYSGIIDVEGSEKGTDAAAILCTVGRGKALLFGPHPEFNPHHLKHDSEVPSLDQVIKTLKSTNKARVDFLRACLSILEVKVNEKDYDMPRLTPLYLHSIDCESADHLISSMERNIGYQIQNIMDVGADKFAINKTSEYPNNSVNDEALYEDPQLAIKNIYLCEASLPSKSLTPYFDMSAFEKYLKEFYESTEQKITRESLGNTFMYGEVLTSTSVLMDSNFKWLPLLPDGFTITGTVQVAGKGRAGNHWVNPRGVLPTSSVIKIPQSLAQTAPVVFIQYLSSMAYTRAVLEYDVGYDEMPVRIKWPNDIYIKLPQYIGKEIKAGSREITHAKIGGVLVNTNIFNGQFHLIVGAGINVSNQAPTTSINMVIAAMNEHYSNIGSEKRLQSMDSERLLAKYLAIFNKMITRFKRSGFRPFLDEYYNLWFHSNQIVTLNENNGAKAQICGITPDWGMLLAKDLETGTMYQLQPDGNSFDMFNGLISKKR